MQVLNFTEVRNNLKSVFDSVIYDNEEVIVNRKSGENVVIVSLDEYNSFKEMEYLISSEINKDKLLKSAASAKASRVARRNLID